MGKQLDKLVDDNRGTTYNIECVRLLVGAGADINVMAPGGKNLLHLAAQVPTLCRYAVDDVTEEEIAQQEVLQLEMIQVLIDLQVDLVFARAESGQTPRELVHSLTIQSSRRAFS